MQQAGHVPACNKRNLLPSSNNLLIRFHRRLRYLITLHPFTGIATLSPHVAATLTRRLGGVHAHWLLPTHVSGCGNSCLQGFAVQGKFEASRRTYDSLWAAMVAQAAAAAKNASGSSSGERRLQHSLQQVGASGGSSSGGGARLPRVNVIGSGSLAALALPKSLGGSVYVYKDLGYEDYYDTLCRCDN